MNNRGLPQGVNKATMQNCYVLEVTPDIDMAIAEMERGDTITLSEFRKVILKWRDI